METRTAIVAEIEENGDVWVGFEDAPDEDPILMMAGTDAPAGVEVGQSISLTRRHRDGRPGRWQAEGFAVAPIRSKTEEDEGEAEDGSTEDQDAELEPEPVDTESEDDAEATIEDLGGATAGAKEDEGELQA